MTTSPALNSDVQPKRPFAHRYRAATGFALLLAATVYTFGYSTMNPVPLQTVEHVDLDRFMGRWHVIANIPTPFEIGAHNATESYAMNQDGSIATTFNYRQDSFDGKRKSMNPTAFVIDKVSNARWGMRFFWPIKADYRISYISADYSQTIVSREKRDYVWIMARTPEIGEADYKKLVGIVQRQGYNVSKLQKVPQSWPEQEQ